MRTATVERKTRETKISLCLDLDGSGKYSIDTDIGFLDHMLGHVAFHGLFDLDLQARGDLQVDPHHTVEDCALALGQAFDQALGDRAGIVRMGSAYVPMDESLAFVCVDLSGRPYLVYKIKVKRERVGELESDLLEEFWKAVVTHARLNLHVELLYGRNTHHIFEAIFKAAARALSLATRIDARIKGVPSTKGVL